MTERRLPRPPWPWADPFWLARKQLEAARLVMRLTESVVDASVSSVLGASGRTAVRPAPSSSSTAPAPAPAGGAAGPAKPPVATLTVTAPAPAEQAATATVTAPAPRSAPVAGWDELSLGSIRARLRRLSEADLVALHGYEESHAARPDVLSMLHNRLIKVRSES